MVRGKAPGSEMLRSVKHDHHPERAYKHRFDGSQEDTEQQIDSFFQPEIRLHHRYRCSYASNLEQRFNDVFRLAIAGSFAAASTAGLQCVALQYRRYAVCGLHLHRQDPLAVRAVAKVYAEMNNAMSFAIWAVILGTLLISMVLSGSLLKRLPISMDMLYLAVSIVLGSAGRALLTPNPLLHALLLERISEVAVLISLFAAGLKLGLPIADRLWRMPIRLVFISMTLTVALIALIGVYGLGLSLGAAILLRGILAPTDPVLAADVQVANAEDRDWLRFSLTGEGGLNDGAAMPFVLLGLGLLGLHNLGPSAWPCSQTRPPIPNMPALT